MVEIITKEFILMGRTVDLVRPGASLAPDVAVSHRCRSHRLSCSLWSLRVCPKDSVLVFFSKFLQNGHLCKTDKCKVFLGPFCVGS